MGRAGYETTYVCNDKDSAAADAIAMHEVKRAEAAASISSPPDTTMALTYNRRSRPSRLLRLQKPNSSGARSLVESWPHARPPRTKPPRRRVPTSRRATQTRPQSPEDLRAPPRHPRTTVSPRLMVPVWRQYKSWNLILKERYPSLIKAGGICLAAYHIRNLISGVRNGIALRYPSLV